MILGDSLLRRNVAEDSTLLLIVASHAYKDDVWASCVTPDYAFFRNLLGWLDPTDLAALATHHKLRFATLDKPVKLTHPR